MSKCIVEKVEITIADRILWFINKIPYYRYRLNFRVNNSDCSVVSEYEFAMDKENVGVLGKYYNAGKDDIVDGIVFYETGIGVSGSYLSG